MQDLEKRFWQLIQSYERLLHEERFAVSNSDFTYAETIVSKKGAILTALNKLEALIDKLYWQSDEFRERMDRLRTFQEETHTLLQQMMDDIQSQLATLDQSSQKLKKVKGAYSTNRKSKSRFIA